MSKATTMPLDGETLVANVNGKYLRFTSLKEVPHGSKVYSTADDLKSQTKEQLEKLHTYVTGNEETFESHAAAVAATWVAFENVDQFDAATHLPPKEEPPVEEPKKAGGKKKADAAGGKTYVKKRDSTRIILKPVTEKSLAAIEKLAPQAKACVTILRKISAGGQVEFTEAELKAHFAKSKEDNELTTKQPAWRIFQYYRSDLIHADVLIVQ